MNKTNMLLIYPPLGSWDTVVRDIPLSLIYAAADSVKAGYEVKIIDLRVVGELWQNEIDNVVENGCDLIGISVMTGNPINTSLEVSRYIKGKYDVPIVWGGPHPTILPEQTLESEYIDYVIRDWGSKASKELLDHLTGKSIQKENITGLGYKENGLIKLASSHSQFEKINYLDLPYHLVDLSGKTYNRLNSGELLFPIYTSMGCPYQCSFCMSPRTYKKIKGKKWLAFDAQTEVLDHIQYLSDNFSFTRLQVYDDDAFVDLERMRQLLKGYIQRGFNKKYKIDFRGVRINELDKMDDEMFELLVEAGTELMFAGMESGSPRVLKIMKKGITKEQILRVNKKIAEYPSLKIHYNFFCGVPGETVEDLIETKDLLIQLVKDHPGCLLGRGGHWKPIPGSVLTDVAIEKYGVKMPANLEAWAKIDSKEAEIPNYPWYSQHKVNMISMLALAGVLLDSKFDNYSGNLHPLLRIPLSFALRLYKPIFNLRLKYNFCSFLFEAKLYRLFDLNLGKLLKKQNR
jgi:radical SAM superfamily enzyme YgiQ (UPF0313 family)